MSNVLIDRQKIDILANAISDKSGVPVTMTLNEMVEAVDGIETNPAPTLQAKTYTVDSAGTATVTADSGYDGLSSVQVSVPSGDPDIFWSDRGFYTESNQRKWRVRPLCDFPDGEGHGWMGQSVAGDYLVCSAVAKNTSITPTESSQTIGGANYMMEGAVTVNAIPSNYVGSGITQRSSSDLTASGATVTVPSGYYSAQASKSVASGTAGTPTATKGTVSNHQVSVTPSVTNTTGYISGGTKNGTAVTVTASELASGNKAITQNGTDIDVVGYSTVSVDVPSSGGVTVTDVANTTGTTCVITTGSAPSEDIPLNTQLIDFTAVKNGYIVDGDTGEETVSQWSSCSDFTLIDPSMTFSYIGYQWYPVVFYDSGKSYISGFNMYQDADVTITNDYAHGTLTPSKIPSTAKYVRIDSYPTNPNSTQLSLIRTA